jgi:uncharacterized protein
VGGALVAANVVNNRVLPEGDAPYVTSCLLGAWTLVAIARADGASWDDLGLARGPLGAGVRIGATAATVALCAAGVSVAATAQGRAALRDDRATRLGRAGAVRAALVRVPLGTVALEEVAFRSVLPAVLEPRVGRGRAAALAAGLFGLWHLLPSVGLSEDNAAVGALTGGSSRRAVALSVAATAAAGLGFEWLRRRAGSVAAPAVLHWATNASGYLAAAAAR